MLHVGTERAEYAPFIVLGLVIVAFVLWRWRTTDRGAERIDRVTLRLPLLGDIRLKYQVATFSRMLSTLLQGGMPLVPSMETAGASMSSRQILNGSHDRLGRVSAKDRALAKSLEAAEDLSRTWRSRCSKSVNPRARCRPC